MNVSIQEAVFCDLIHVSIQKAVFFIFFFYFFLFSSLHEMYEPTYEVPQTATPISKGQHAWGILLINLLSLIMKVLKGYIFH